jgi:hypothetical protein
MKKTLGTLSILLISCTVISAQTFQKGSLITSLNFGLDVYSTQYSQTINYYGYGTNTQSSNGGAAAVNYNLGAEYGITNWLGLGLQGKFDNYLIGKDSNQSGGVKSA